MATKVPAPKKKQREAPPLLEQTPHTKLHFKK
jgi:hypothetical protein